MKTINGSDPRFLQTEHKTAIFSVYKGWEDGEIEVAIPRNCHLQKIKGSGFPHWIGGKNISL